MAPDQRERRRAVAFAPRAFAIVLGAVVAGQLLAGCASERLPLEDPRAVLAGAFEAVAQSSSVRYVAKLEGEVPLPAAGSTEQAPFELAGTTLSGELDIVGGSGTAILSIPGLGPAFDAIVVGSDLYARVGLLGGDYRRSSVGTSPLAILGDASAGVDALESFLRELPEPPVLGEPRDCGEARCYRVTLVVPAGAGTDVGGLLGGLLGGLSSGLGDLGGLGGFGPFPPGGFGPGSGSDGTTPLPLPSAAASGGTAEILVRIDDLRPVSIVLRSMGSDGASITLELSEWNAPVTIVRPD